MSASPPSRPSPVLSIVWSCRHARPFASWTPVCARRTFARRCRRRLTLAAIASRQSPRLPSHAIGAAAYSLNTHGVRHFRIPFSRTLLPPLLQTHSRLTRKSNLNCILFTCARPHQGGTSTKWCGVYLGWVCTHFNTGAARGTCVSAGVAERCAGGTVRPWSAIFSHMYTASRASFFSLSTNKIVQSSSKRQYFHSVFNSS